MCMKSSSIIFVLTLMFTCGTPLPGYSVKPIGNIKYSTSFIMQWAYTCVNTLKHNFYQDGIPAQYAEIKAGQYCSCVIDEFRKYYTQEEVVSMSTEDRRLFSQHFTSTCTGQPSSFH